MTLLIFIKIMKLKLTVRSIISYAYFTLTRQEYLYPDAADRQRLMLFHKKARKHRWDVEKYNRIKQVSQIFQNNKTKSYELSQES